MLQNILKILKICYDTTYKLRITAKSANVFGLFSAQAQSLVDGEGKWLGVVNDLRNVSQGPNIISRDSVSLRVFATVVTSTAVNKIIIIIVNTIIIQYATNHVVDCDYLP